jgi:quinol monooxygenase YgiN
MLNVRPDVNFTAESDDTFTDLVQELVLPTVNRDGGLEYRRQRHDVYWIDSTTMLWLTLS